MKVINDGTLHATLETGDPVEPCPFCGSSKIEMCNTWTPSYWVGCTSCGAEAHPKSTGWKKGDDRNPAKHLAAAKRALKAWNRRAA